MTRNNRALHVVRGLSVLASSLALVLAAVGTTAAHPTTVVHVAASVQAGNLRDIVTARILLIEPGITADELDELVDQLVNDADDGDEADADEPKVDEPEVDQPEAADADDGDADEVDEPEVDDDDQGDDNDDQGEDTDDDDADDADDVEEADDDDGDDGDGD